MCSTNNKKCLLVNSSRSKLSALKVLLQNFGILKLFFSYNLFVLLLLQKRKENFFENPSVLKYKKLIPCILLAISSKELLKISRVR